MICLELTDEQMQEVGHALQIYGRMRLLQFDFVMDDLVPNLPWDKRGKFEEDMKHLFIGLGYRHGISRKSWAFDIGRSIHAFFHEYQKNCCPCWRSLDPFGSPEHKIYKKFDSLL